MKNYYKILELDQKASAVEIRDAFRRLSKMYHPDLNQQDKDFEDYFKELQEAYSVLRDKSRKEAYDAALLFYNSRHNPVRRIEYFVRKKLSGSRSPERSGGIVTAPARPVSSTFYKILLVVVVLSAAAAIVLTVENPNEELHAVVYKQQIDSTPADSLLASMPPVPEFPLTKTEPAEADISNKEPLEEESQTEREHLQPVVEKKQLEKKSTEGYVAEEKTAMATASVEMVRELPEMETKTANTAKKEESNKTAEKIYTSPEKMPRFSKGAAAFVQYLNENLNYPEKARERGITGRVLLNFIVEKDGEISNISVIQGIGGGCDEEAVAVMERAPKWLPGEQNGEKVRVQCTIPITFALQ